MKREHRVTALSIWQFKNENYFNRLKNLMKLSWADRKYHSVSLCFFLMIRIFPLEKSNQQSRYRLMAKNSNEL